MDLAHARALLPAGRVWAGEYRPDRDAVALRALAEWATRFSPLVAPDPPDGLLLDISGCERVFRGEARLVNSIANQLERFGFAVRVATAPTFGCAWAIARFGRRERSMVPDDRTRDALAPLPVEALRISPDAAAALREVGVDRVEHILNLPRAALPVRFGPELLLRIDQTFGRALELIEPVRPVDPPRVERIFDGPTTQYEAIELTARHLVEQMSHVLAARESGARRLDLHLKRVDDAPLVISVALGRASRSVPHLWTLLRPHLERANLGFGVEEVALVAPRVSRLKHEQAAALGAPADEIPAAKAVGELTDTLVNRFGPHRVGHAEPVESHIPERAIKFSAGPSPEKPDAPLTKPPPKKKRAKTRARGAKPKLDRPADQGAADQSSSRQHAMRSNEANSNAADLSPEISRSDAPKGQAMVATGEAQPAPAGTAEPVDSARVMQLAPKGPANSSALLASPLGAIPFQHPNHGFRSVPLAQDSAPPVATIARPSGTQTSASSTIFPRLSHSDTSTPPPRLNPDATPRRPSILFDHPEPATAMAITPDGPPSLLRWRGRDHAIPAAIGPERIAGEWWHRREPTRDYFKVQTQGGRWLWVFREIQTNQWFVHGEWA